MNGPIGGRRPPRQCPICDDSSYWSGSWSRDYRGYYANVYTYNDHLRDDHPAYRTWKRKLSALYVVPIILLFGSVPASIILAGAGTSVSLLNIHQGLGFVYPSDVNASGTRDVNLSVVLLFWLLALLSGLLIIIVRGRGTKKIPRHMEEERGTPPAS